MRTLIIEDEQPAALQLIKLLRAALPEVQIADTIDTVQGAVQWLRAFPPPELLFMDIQLADGLSLDIFGAVTVTAPVIFTTAFDQYAVQAFKVNAVDYLLKPIDPDELSASLARVRERRAAPLADMAALAQLFQPRQYKDRFLVKTNTQLVLLPAAEVGWFRSEGSLTRAYTTGGKAHFIDHSLDELERLLDPAAFFRISRNMIVRTSAIARITPHFNGRLKLSLLPAADAEVFVSRERVGDFKAWLGG